MPEKRVLTLVAASTMLLAACGGFGTVNQGRVVEYDPAKGVLTLISEPAPHQQAAEQFGVLPPVTIQVPDDPHQMGPAPQAGKLMSVDAANRQVVIFDAAAQSFKNVPYTPVEQRENVRANDPAVSKLPRIDRDKKTITIYSPAQKVLLTFSVPDDYLDLPVATWVAGDQVRYYYKDPHKALRLMNVTRSGVL